MYKQHTLWIGGEYFCIDKRQTTQSAVLHCTTCTLKRDWRPEQNSLHQWPTSGVLITWLNSLNASWAQMFKLFWLTNAGYWQQISILSHYKWVRLDGWCSSQTKDATSQFFSANITDHCKANTNPFLPSKNSLFPVIDGVIHHNSTIPPKFLHRWMTNCFTILWVHKLGGIDEEHWINA